MHKLKRVTNHVGQASQAHLISFQPWPLLPGAEVLSVSFRASAASVSVIEWKWHCGRGSGSSGKILSTVGGLSLKNRFRSVDVMMALLLDSPASVDRAGMFRWHRPCCHCAAFHNNLVVALWRRLLAQSFLAVQMVEHKFFWAALFPSLVVEFWTTWTACWQSLFHHQALLGLYSLRCSKMAIETLSI